MFEISEQTKAKAVAHMKSALIETFNKELLKNDEDLINEKVAEAFDAAVAIVKAQFGM